jgi:nucleoside-diphosphate-sugar epimerase
MSRILVTGASGFIGSATVTALAKARHHVRAAVRNPEAAEFPASVEVATHADLTSPVDWKPMLEGIDAVIHLAGVAHTGRKTPESVYDRVNRETTAKIAAAAAAAGVQRFVFISSIRAQTGPAADHALTESDEPRPVDAYGRSKLAAEAAVREAGVPFTILRPVLVYGPGVKGNLARLVEFADSRWPLPFAKFNNRRSLLGIDNLITAMIFALNTPATAGETYVVADPDPMRLADVIATIREAQGRARMLLPAPPAMFELPFRLVRRYDVFERFGGNLRVDPGKLLAAGWQPRVETRIGLSAMCHAASPRKSGTASRNTR